MLRRRTDDATPAADDSTHPGEGGAKRLIRTIVRRHWPALGGAAGSTVLLTLAELAQPWPLKFLIDEVITGRQVPFQFTSSDARALALIAAAVIGIAVLDALATYTGDLWLKRSGERIAHDLRLAMYSHLQRLSLAYHDRRQKGDLVTRLTGDVNAVGTLFSDNLGAIAQAVLTLVGMVIVSVVIDPLLGLAMFAVAPVLGVVTLHYRRAVRVAARRQREREGEIASLAAESLAAMRVVKALGGERYEADRVSERSEERRQQGVYAANLEAKFGGAVDVLGSAAVATVLVLGAYRAASGAISVGDLVVIAQYARRMYRPLSDLAKQSTRVSRAMARAERVAEVLGADEVLDDRPGAYAGGRAHGEVELRDVTFAYEPDRPVLEGLSLRFAAGSRVAVVGPSGAGKSTIGALIARFYDPSAGAVLIDGRDARECSLDWLRDQVGILLQDTVLFSGTVAENIAYGRSAAREDIVRAARAADAEDFISALPGGFDAELGPQGIGLSGGQRQRIGIARVLLRDPPILVLDEPTTGLDAASEAQVMDGLGALMRGRTTILITHSMALAREADRAIVVEAGGIVQEGAPEELVALPGPFRRLAAEQGLVVRRRRPAPPPDRAVPALRALLDADGAAPVLQRSLGAERVIDDIDIRNVRYRPGRDLTVLYRATIDGERHEAVIVASRDAPLAEVARDPRHLRAARAVDGRSPAAAPLSYDPQAHALIQWLPLDLALPLLSAPPDVLAGHLRALGIEVGDGPVEPVRVSYAPGRRATLRLGDHVLRGYGDEDAFRRALAGWRIASDGTLGRDPRARETWTDLLRSLSSRRRPAASGPRPTTAVFEGAVPDLRATVQLVLDGTSPGGGPHTARAAGALLRRIHALPSDGLPSRSAGHTLEAARRAATVLQAVDPPATDRIRRLLERLERRLPAEEPTVTSHGDFHRGELIRRGGELAVLDVNEACLAAPARDLATYAAHAATHDDGDAPALLEALVAGYGGRPGALSWYLSASLLRRAERPFRVLEEDWPTRVEELVEAAAAALEG
jgi:ABC-type multidrug transport system fused ATPase/permease subunit